MTTPARPTPKAQRRRARHGNQWKRRGRTPKNRRLPESRLIPSYVAAGLVFALCAWAWIAPPGVARAADPMAAPSREYREASARVALALHAQRIEAYRASHGRLPRTKQEVGIASDQIMYDRTDSLNFELVVASRRTTRDVTGRRSHATATSPKR